MSTAYFHKSLMNNPLLGAPMPIRWEAYGGEGNGVLQTNNDTLIAFIRSKVKARVGGVAEISGQEYEAKKAESPFKKTPTVAATEEGHRLAQSPLAFLKKPEVQPEPPSQPPEKSVEAAPVGDSSKPVVSEKPSVGKISSGGRRKKASTLPQEPS